MSDDLHLADLPARFFGAQDRLKGLLDESLCAPDYRATIAGFPVMDRAGHGGFGQAFYAGFPDLYHTIDNTIVSNGRVATRFTLRGTHTAPFMGIPATGRTIMVSAMVHLTMSGVRVQRLDAIFDQMGLMKQLGVIPGDVEIHPLTG